MAHDRRQWTATDDDQRQRHRTGCADRRCVAAPRRHGRRGESASLRERHPRGHRTARHRTDGERRSAHPGRGGGDAGRSARLEPDAGKLRNRGDQGRRTAQPRRAGGTAGVFRLQSGFRGQSERRLRYADRLERQRTRRYAHRLRADGQLLQLCPRRSRFGYAGNALPGGQSGNRNLRTAALQRHHRDRFRGGYFLRQHQRGRGGRTHARPVDQHRHGIAYPEWGGHRARRFHTR